MVSQIKHSLTVLFRQEELQQLVKNIPIPTLSVESVESQTSICRRESAHPLEVEPRREDTVGPWKPLEETELEPVEWDTSDTFTEERRTDTDTVLKLPRIRPPTETSAQVFP